ncbi:MAG: carbohydrate ABC transporter permease [Clostridiales bacterium]|nr:carbohydrate ABC transporter permease [Clostridiales bacterium]
MKKRGNTIMLSQDRKVFNVLAYTFIVLITVLCLLPFWLVVIGSVTDESEIFVRGFSLWPEKFSVEAYKLAFKYPDRIFRAYGITVSITAIGTFVSLLITAMCGYALQRDEFRSRGFFTMFIFFTMLFNGGLVPWYLLITNYLKLKDTYMVMILTLLVNVYHIILMKNFMKTVPKALVEAARIDGGGEFYIFFRIILPLVKPALASIGMFTALGYWNEWRTGMLFLQSSELFPLQYYLYRLLNSVEFLKNATADMGASLTNISFPSESLKMAMTVIATGPIVLLYPMLQKYFVKGITIGAVKD